MTTTASLDRLADETRLDVAVARLDQPDATLTDIANVLFLLAGSDPVRVQGVLAKVRDVLSRYDTATRWAPPAALTELVRDVRADCRNAHNGCLVDVYPWEPYYPYCGTSCGNQDAAVRL